jgi:hypothetical protein
VPALELELLRLARAPRRTSGRNEQHVTVAKEMLRSEETTAIGCLHALTLLYGDGVRAWEPETIWLTLDRADVDAPLLNRDKILAAFTLLMLPAFWWEVSAFENTVCVFNNVHMNPETLHEASPAQIAWAVYEAELLFAESDIDETPEFDHEPITYTGTVLHRAGFLVAPQLLRFAQTTLDKLNGTGAVVTKQAVQDAWKRIEAQETPTLGDTPLDIQLGRLLGVRLYLQERLKVHEADMAKLRR